MLGYQHNIDLWLVVFHGGKSETHVMPYWLIDIQVDIQNNVQTANKSQWRPATLDLPEALCDQQQSNSDKKSLLTTQWYLLAIRI